MNETHTGSNDAYKTLYLAGGAEVTVAGSDLRQLDFRATQGAGETRLCAAGGVPPIIVGLSEGLQAATYSNYSSARRKFGDGWARPQWRSAFAALASITEVPPDAELWYDDRDISFLREDQKDAATIQGTNATTINVYITAGFTPESSVAAVVNADPTLLVHSGMVSVQLQPPGTGVPEEDPALAGETGDVIEGEEAPPALPAGETSRARPRGDEVLKDYWLVGEGAARWASWTDLYEHLKKHMADGKARQIAASWFHERYGTWPGSDENRVAHGKPPRGDKVGPG